MKLSSNVLSQTSSYHYIMCLLIIVLKGDHYIADGVAMPVLVYNPSNNSNQFYNVFNQTLMWQGKK